MVSKSLVVPTLFGLILWVGCSSHGSTPAGPPAVLPPVQPSAGSASKYISHVIVIIQENRSFENFFAGWPGANAPLTGCASPSPGPDGSARVAPASQAAHPLGVSCPPGDSVVTLHQVTFENNADLEHDWGSSMTDWNKGQMDGFSAYGNNHGPDQAYAYVEHSQIEPYRLMAKRYVLADAMFPTEFGGSFTGHLTLVAGTDDIELPSEAEVNFPSHAPDDCDSPPHTKSSYLTPNRVIHFFDGPFPCFDQFNTMAQVLDDAKVSWKMYATQLVDGGFWEPFEAIKYVRHGSDWKTNIIAPQTKFLTDASSGQLASVSWVTPTRPDSDHPAYRGDKGPSWVASIVNAIGTSSYWSKSAIIVVWDDWGGFYDNARAAAARLSRPGHARSLSDHLAVCQARRRRSHKIRVRQHPEVHRGGQRPSGREHRIDLGWLYRRACEESRQRIRLYAKTAQILADSFEISDLTLYPRAAG